MDLQQLLATLEVMDNGAEMVRTVKSLADEIGKKNREAKNLRARAKKAEDRVAALTDKLSRVAAFIGLEEAEDLDSALEALKQKQWQAGDGKGQPSSEIAWIRSQLSQLQQEMKNLSAPRELFLQVTAQEKIKRIEVFR
ncbi:MAG TPA: hypothetical protein PKA10_18325 [Selenomonadales bacterium]|nr:hypothetical protein [Selenomonadales bacterium]